VTDKLIENVIINLPNFAGFVLLAFMQWRTIQILLKMVENHKDDDDDD